MKPLLLSYLFVAFTFIPINPDSGNGCARHVNYN